MAMDGLGIDTSGGGLKDSRKLSKGKAAETSQQQQQISAATSYVVSKIDAGQAVLISDAVSEGRDSCDYPSLMANLLLRFTASNSRQYSYHQAARKAVWCPYHAPEMLQRNGAAQMTFGTFRTIYSQLSVKYRLLRQPCDYAM